MFFFEAYNCSLRCRHNEPQPILQGLGLSEPWRHLIFAAQAYIFATSVPLVVSPTLTSKGLRFSNVAIVLVFKCALLLHANARALTPALRLLVCPEIKQFH